MKSDIQNLSDIKLLVDTFYGKVQTDPLIGHIFTDRIKDWPVHLAKMYCFWQTVLLDEHTYTGTPFAPHANMPLAAAHFESWVAIWTNSIDLLFIGKKAAEAKKRGELMATLFLSKIENHLNSNHIPLV